MEQYNNWSGYLDNRDLVLVSADWCQMCHIHASMLWMFNVSKPIVSCLGGVSKWTQSTQKVPVRAIMCFSQLELSVPLNGNATVSQKSLSRPWTWYTVEWCRWSVASACSGHEQHCTRHWGHGFDSITTSIHLPLLQQAIFHFPLLRLPQHPQP